MTAAIDVRKDKPVKTTEPAPGIRELRSRPTLGGPLALAGAIVMAAGGIVWGTAGADLWGLVDGDVATADFLADTASSASTLTAAHIIWLLGVFTLALGGILLAGPGSTDVATAARATYGIGAALAMPSFVIMIALTRLAERGGTDLELAEALAFVGARLDDLATAVLVGLGPVLIALANRGTWLPRWLTIWAGVCGVAGVVSLMSIPFGLAGTLGFVVVPVGIVWTICAGIVSLRARREAR